MKETIKMTAYPGDNINSVAKIGKERAIDKNCIVEFDFNGITCRVGEENRFRFAL